MDNRFKQNFQCVANALLRLFFSDAYLHRYFRSGNSKPEVIATYDILNLTPQSKMELMDSHHNFGIVIQGPIAKDITLNFCNFIKFTYPNVMTVLSTWDDEDISTFEPLIGPNFRILQSKKPEYPGPANINMQIVSTRAGIQALVALGCDRILKTRTDIFLANPQFLNYFSWAKSKGESHSIVFSSFDSFLFRFFSVSDQVMFGSADDLTVFWNLNLVAPNETPPISEVHLFQEYLKRNEFLPEDTFDSYMAALRDYAVIADHEQIGQIWNKGTFTSLGFRWRGSTSPHPMSPLTHWLWDSIRQDASYLRSLLSKLT